MFLSQESGVGAATALRPPQRGDLWIEGKRIAAVSPPDPAPAWPEPVERVDARGLWILPGFVQTHVHLCQSLFRGLGEGLDLYEWLLRVIWPGEAALDAETTEVAAELGVAQLLAGGTTTILDMGTTRHAESILRVLDRCGLRARTGPALMDQGPAGAAPLLRDPVQSLSELEELAARWEGFDEGRLGLALCPRFVPSVSAGFWREMLLAPAFRSFPVHTHCAETRAEVEEVRSMTGRTPAAFLSGLDGAEGRVKAAHAVWLTPEDRSALKRSGTAVLHCPGSNLKLGSGIADILALREAGIPLGLGADGSACNNRLDAWQEMRLAALLQALLHGPASVDPADFLRMATYDGAGVLGLENDIGSLRAGKRADLVLVDPDRDEAALGADPEGRALRTGPDLRLPEDRSVREGPSRDESPETVLVFAGSPLMVRECWVDGVRLFTRDGASSRNVELSERVRRAGRALFQRLGRTPA